MTPSIIFCIILVALAFVALLVLTGGDPDGRA
jgi:hypothetical protein